VRDELAAFRVKEKEEAANKAQKLPVVGLEDLGVTKFLGGESVP